MLKARVYVTLKTTVLDAQGQTVRSALAGLGYSGIADVRQGKYFEIALSPDVTADEAKRQIDEIARDVLANPVIEDYRVEVM